MNNSSIALEPLRQFFTNPTGGVLGLVDGLLAAAREQSLQLDWKEGHCRVQFREGGPSGLIEAPLRKSVVRAALARIAVLCNQRRPNSVSPYGGQGELSVGAAPPTVMQVAFVNTPDEQSLELTPLRTESVSAMPEAAIEGQNLKASQVPGSQADGNPTSGEKSVKNLW